VTLADEVIAAARVLAAKGLVDAFGHVSARAGQVVAITPARPLGMLSSGDELVTLRFDAQALSARAPKEAWAHLAIYRNRADVGAICRAQPPWVAAAAAAGLELEPLHGQAMLLGEAVPIHDDAILVRDRERGEAVAETLGDAHAVILRGNGALTVGDGPGAAAARMVVLDASARLNVLGAAAGTRVALRAEERDAWSAVAPELLARLWHALR
jgi:ribulose-5-phosphate 4-epimerase/fuculose-1-phosphate aldolase